MFSLLWFPEESDSGNNSVQPRMLMLPDAVTFTKHKLSSLWSQSLPPTKTAWYKASRQTEQV